MQPLTIEVTKDMLNVLGISLEYNQFSGNVQIKGLSDNCDPKVQLLALAKNYLNEFGYSHTGLEDFLLYIAHKNSYNPVAEEILELSLWDKQDRLNELTKQIMGLKTAEDAKEEIYVRKWLHQTLSLALNDDQKPRAGAGVLVFFGNNSATPLLEKLALKPELFAEKIYIDSADANSRQRATSTWITDFRCIYHEADNSFFLSSQDMHRPLFAREDMPKARRTSFCANLLHYPERVPTYIFWTVCTNQFDMDKIAALDKNWIYQLWMQVFEELYIPNPAGFTLSARPSQENSALKFFVTHMDFCDGENDKADTEEQIYGAYLDWCKAKTERIVKSKYEFFGDIRQYLSYIGIEAEKGLMLR